MELLNQGCEIIRVHNSGVAGAGFVLVGEIVSTAVVDGVKACLCEWSKLIVPIGTVADQWTKMSGVPCPLSS